jgi:hypothetical protein
MRETENRSAGMITLLHLPLNVVDVNNPSWITILQPWDNTGILSALSAM